MSAILKLVQGSPAWLEHRRKYRNASETPAVIGVSPWQTPYQLWLERTGRAQPKINAAMIRGAELEPAARAAYEKLTGNVVEPLVVVDGEYSASLDGITLSGEVLVEIKIPMQGRNSQTWQAIVANEVPEPYFWQIQTQLMVTGAALGHLYVFDGTGGALVEVSPESRSWDRIRSDWNVFWDFLTKDQPPPLSERDTKKREDDAWKQAAETYICAKQAADSASASLDAAKERLTALAQHPRESGFSVTVTRYWKNGAIDYKKVAELKGVALEKYRAAGREEVRVSVT
jgi:putative phage-type endonuclease